MLTSKDMKSKELEEAANHVRVAIEALFGTMKKLDYDNKAIATCVLIVAQEKLFQVVNESQEIDSNKKINYSSELIYEVLMIVRRIMSSPSTDDEIDPIESGAIIH